MFTWIQAVAAAVLLLLIFLAALDVYWPITVVLVVGIAAGFFFLGWPVLQWVTANPWMIVAYLAIGIPWIFFRWTRYIEERFKAAKAHKDTGRHHIPTWSEHKWEYAPYYFYWPVDMAAYLLSDVLRDVWDAVSAMVTRSFDRYAEWRFSKLP